MLAIVRGSGYTLVSVSSNDSVALSPKNGRRRALSLLLSNPVDKSEPFCVLAVDDIEPLSLCVEIVYDEPIVFIRISKTVS